MLNELITRSFAESCEERFLGHSVQVNPEHLAPAENFTQSPPDSSHLYESRIVKPLDRTLSNPLVPHAHKMKMGQKYHGSTRETFILEGQKKRKQFHQFFQKNYPSIKMPQTEMDFWSHLKINDPKSFQIAMSAAKALQSKGYPLSGFIYIINSDLSLSIAPRTIIKGKDTGDAKHIGLANGDSILASGEFEVKYPAGDLRYNLKSGTYMASLKEAEQFDICSEMEDYFVELTKLPIKFSEVF